MFGPIPASSEAKASSARCFGRRRAGIYDDGERAGFSVPRRGDPQSSEVELTLAIGVLRRPSDRRVRGPAAVRLWIVERRLLDEAAEGNLALSGADGVRSR
jgi:hypothetical protein